MTLVREMDRTTMGISNRMANRVGRKLLVLLNIRERSSRTGTGQLVRQMLACQVFRSSSNGVGLGIRRVNNDMLIISRFALPTSAGGNAHPNFSGKTRPISTRHLCSCFSSLYRRGVGAREKQFTTSVGISLIGSKPIAF